jgi:hypothetical protein
MVCVCGAGWLASSPSPPLTFRRVKRELGGIAIFLGVMRKGKGRKYSVFVWLVGGAGLFREKSTAG